MLVVLKDLFLLKPLCTKAHIPSHFLAYIWIKILKNFALPNEHFTKIAHPASSFENFSFLPTFVTNKQDTKNSALAIFLLGLPHYSSISSWLFISANCSSGRKITKICKFGFGKVTILGEQFADYAPGSQPLQDEELLSFSQTHW